MMSGFKFNQVSNTVRLVSSRKHTYPISADRHTAVAQVDIITKRCIPLLLVRIGLCYCAYYPTGMLQYLGHLNRTKHQKQVSLLAPPVLLLLLVTHSICCEKSLWRNATSPSLCLQMSPSITALLLAFIIQCNTDCWAAVRPKCI